MKIVVNKAAPATVSVNAMSAGSVYQERCVGAYYMRTNSDAFPLVALQSGTLCDARTCIGCSFIPVPSAAMTVA